MATNIYGFALSGASQCGASDGLRPANCSHVDEAVCPADAVLADWSVRCSFFRFL
jgi:hypothetical protein